MVTLWNIVLGLIGVAGILAIPLTAHVLLGPGLERMLTDLFPRSPVTPTIQPASTAEK